MDLRQLKSGTDLRGTAIGEVCDLTFDAVYCALKAFCIWLKKRENKENIKVALGRDSRISGKRIEEAAKSALVESGCEIYLCGLCSTPSMFMMTKYGETKCDGAVMITASHHPFDKNGLKFFSKDGGAESKELDEILEIAQNVEIKTADGARAHENAKLIEKDFMKLYCDFLVKKIQDGCREKQPLANMKIAVDAGNGAGGFFADRVLKCLGADVSSSQFLLPDGNFPNHIPNPENEAAMRSISERVVQCGSDLGIIFDTDVDRCAIVSRSGAEINRNRLIALISAVLLKEKENFGATIVTDSVTSDGLKSFIEACGGVHHRFKRGYKNVINEAIRFSKEGVLAPLAIETSGHAAFRENYYLDDGAYLAVKLLIAMANLKKEGKTLDSLIENLQEPLESGEFRIKITAKDFQKVGNEAIDRLKDLCLRKEKEGLFKIAPSTYEGCRANVKESDGWFLARMSVHDPVMPINIESGKKGGVQEMVGFLRTFFKEFDSLDCSALENCRK